MCPLLSVVVPFEIYFDSEEFIHIPNGYKQLYFHRTETSQLTKNVAVMLHLHKCNVKLLFCYYVVPTLSA